MILMRKNNSGQIVVIALLIGLVVLTIGLGVASRAITDIKLSRQEQESGRAFNIAEAGIEELLKKPSLSVADSYTGKKVGDITREVNVYEEGYLEVLVEPNETIGIDISDIDFDGSLTISWVKDGKGEDPGTCSEGERNASASIEVMVYREEGSTYSVRRSGYNSCSGLGNEFETAGSGSGFKSSQEVDILDNDDKLVRIRVLYNKATVKVEGGDLGAQMYRITSRAQAEVGETRQVEVERTKPALPAIFDYVLFSKGSLVK